MPNHSPVYQSFGAQPNAANYNPYTQQNPTLGDYINQRIGQYMKDGMSQQEATANAIQEGTAYNKGDGPHPKAFSDEWDTNQNDAQAGQYGQQTFNEFRQREEARANYNPYNTTNSEGTLYGDHTNQRLSTEQSAVQAAELARSKAMGKMYGEAVLGGRMNGLRNLQVVGPRDGDSPYMTKPTYTGR